MQYLNSIKEWVSTPKGAIILSSVFAVLTAVRLWARGATCQVDRDLTGKIVVITGASTGIGKETMRELSKRNCTIYFGAKDGRKSERTLKEISKQIKNAKIIFFPLDLADKQSISEFANKIKQQVDKIDILINNAGLGYLPERRVTNDGFQMQMGVNYLGHFYLTYLLWDKIKKSDEFRIINVSSKAHDQIQRANYYPKVDFEDLHYTKNYSFGESYGRSKVAIILFTRELQRKIDQAGLPGTTVSLHPGTVKTEFGRYLSKTILVILTIFSPIFILLSKTPIQGAQTTLHLALEQKDKLQKGEYYVDCVRTPTSPFASNMENAGRLWKLSEQELGVKFNL